MAFKDLKVLHFPSECHLSVSISLCVHVHVAACVCVSVCRTLDSQMVVLSCSSGCPIHHVEREHRGLGYEHCCILLIIKGHTGVQCSNCFTSLESRYSHKHTN